MHYGRFRDGEERSRIGGFGGSTTLKSLDQSEPRGFSGSPQPISDNVTTKTQLSRAVLSQHPVQRAKRPFSAVFDTKMAAAASSSQQQAATQQKQPQGQSLTSPGTLDQHDSHSRAVDLQTQYSNYKNTLQQIAQKIGDIEQEAEEHKFVTPLPLLDQACAGNFGAAFWGSQVLPTDQRGAEKGTGRYGEAVQVEAG
ncbi:hypothetical protein Golomagni_06933 [Golovinomyces magnicellulatus]|nr:hypothetical protein Golomagni_06933 [Golovinomyces magnicellulatus]